MEQNNPTPIEVRCLSTDLLIESRAEQLESRTITGYAVKFSSWSAPIMGWFKEQIARSAFEGCDMSDVIVCFNHNVDDILARTTSGTLTLSTDDIGLRFSFEVPHTTRGDDMLELVKRGDIHQCSFKFIVEKDEWRYADEQNGLPYDERTILKIATLKDVALVVFPAYQETEASVRRLEERKAEFMEQEMAENTEQHNPISSTSINRNRQAQMLRLKK